MQDHVNITLYLIAHDPDAGYLRRLLAKVKPIVTQVALVVTDGGEKCIEVVEQSGIPCYVDRYQVSERKDFDFSVARNKALKLAESIDSDWLLWLDCDDVIDEPERILERLKTHNGANAYGLPYKVSEAADNIFKVRLHKPGEWHWINKVHEELVPVNKQDEGRRLIVFKDCPVTHAPEQEKSNHHFHVELLKEASKDAPNHYAYIGKELMNKLQHADAIPWIEKTIAIHPVEIEVFNAWLNLGICRMETGDDKQAEEAFLRAMQLRPWRKEPYFYLAQIMGLRGDESLKAGLAYASACSAQIDQQEPNQHGNIYKRDGYKLHALFLQKFGLFEDAHAVAMRADDSKDIILSIENDMKQQAINQRDAA